MLLQIRISAHSVIPNLRLIFVFFFFLSFFAFHLVNTSSFLGQMAMKFLTREAVILLTPLALLLRSHLETKNTSYLTYL